GGGASGREASGLPGLREGVRKAGLPAVTAQLQERGPRRIDVLEPPDGPDGAPIHAMRPRAARAAEDADGRGQQDVGGGDRFGAVEIDVDYVAGRGAENDADPGDRSGKHPLDVGRREAEGLPGG